MARPEKEAAVQEIHEIFEKATSVFVTDYKGLNVEQISELRTKCREKAVHYKVVKNTLARLAAKKIGYDEMVDYLEGPSALAFSFEDPSAPAKVISEFAKKGELPVIKMSVFEGVFYGPDRVKEIAALPTRDELLAKLVGGFNAPLQGFAGGLNNLLQKFVGTVDAIRQQKESE